jgi:hypothetical protein
MRTPWSAKWALVPLFALACESEDASSTRPLAVNLQVTGRENLEPMMQEIDRRGLVATIWLSSAEITANCSVVRSLATEGHEIAGKFPAEILPTTSEAEQRAELSALADSAGGCSVPAPEGFRATRFTSNDATAALLDEFGFAYLERSARDEFLSVYTFAPYRAEGHSFAILPMPIRVAYGEVGSLCDTSACGDLSDAEFLRYVQAAIDFHSRTREPLILEWHPELTNPDDTEGWWDTFLGVLDHLQAQGDTVEFVTALDLVGAQGL